MDAARPKTENATFGDALRVLLTIEDGAALEVLLPTIRFDMFHPPLTEEEKATLVNAIISATARCWMRRSCCD